MHAPASHSKRKKTKANDKNFLYSPWYTNLKFYYYPIIVLGKQKNKNGIIQVQQL